MPSLGAEPWWLSLLYGGSLLLSLLALSLVVLCEQLPPLMFLLQRKQS